MEIGNPLIAEWERPQDLGVVHIASDGTPTYRASGLYNCTSILVGARLGIQGSVAPEWMQERFDEGHAFESSILQKCVERGLHLYGFQDETRQPVGKAQIVGHIDALGTGPFLIDSRDGGHPFIPPKPFSWDPEGPVLIDAKAFAQSTWDSWNRSGFDAFPYYAWQQSIYAKYYGNIPIVMAIALKDREKYEAGAAPSECIKDFRLDVFTTPPVPFGKIMQKVLEVERLAAQGMEGLPTECDMASYPCPYWNMPFHTKKAKGVEIKDGNIVGGLEEIAKLADLRAAADARAKAAAQEISDLDEQMKALVNEQEGNAKLAGHSDTVSSVSFYHAGSNTVQWEAIANDYPGFDSSKYRSAGKSSKLSVKLNLKRKSAKPNVAALTD